MRICRPAGSAAVFRDGGGVRCERVDQRIRIGQFRAVQCPGNKLAKPDSFRAPGSGGAVPEEFTQPHCLRICRQHLTECDVADVAALDRELFVAIEPVKTAVERLIVPRKQLGDDRLLVCHDPAEPHRQHRRRRDQRVEHLRMRAQVCRGAPSAGHAGRRSLRRRCVGARRATRGRRISDAAQADGHGRRGWHDSVDVPRSWQRVTVIY